MHLVFRPPPTAHIAWALGDYETRLVLELCQDIARDKTLAWLGDAVAQIRWKGGGKRRARVKVALQKPPPADAWGRCSCAGCRLHRRP
ncbi:hypothetical protein [Streptomyces agglomeratus]|uniref:hypothetical protein n=1 Tax=Streptomyces agglomeratus TaxID=285458 RepID=UPI000B2C306D